ncbi:MAG: glycosyltransferase [Planctomycetota bacterium]
MKVLYITVSMPYGDGEPFFVPEIRETLRQGCELLIVPRSPGGKVTNRDAEGLENLSLSRPLFCWEIFTVALGMVLRHPLRTLRTLWWLFVSRNVTTFIKNLAAYPKALWIAHTARHWGADFIHAHWANTPATMALVASEFTHIPWGCTAHRIDILDDNLLWLKMNHAAFFRFIARDGEVLARSKCRRPILGNLVVLHLGADCPSIVRFKQTISFPPFLVCAGALSQRKGQRFLIEAMRILRERGIAIRLTLVGAGEERQNIVALIEQHGLENCITLLGQLDHAELLKLWDSGEVDIAVLPSLHEGIPLTLIEPMACGIPVVGTTVGGVPELLERGAGILIPPQDAVALADAIQKLITEPGFRQSIAECGRRRVLEGWAVENIVRQWMELVQRAIH